MTFYPNERYIRNKIYDGYEFDKGYSYDDVIDISIPAEDEVFPFSNIQIDIEYTDEGDTQTSAVSTGSESIADVSAYIT